MKIASIKRDSIDVPLASIEKGENATAVSYAEAMKKIEPGNLSGNEIIKRFADPAPIDEVYLKRKDLAKPEEKPQTQKQEEKVNVEKILWTTGIVAVAIMVLLLLLPTIIFRYYVLRYNNATLNAKPYWAYRAATFWLHQVGIYRGDLTPMQYASKEIDPRFGTSFTSFMNIYLKQKYAKQPLSTNEQQTVTAFLKPFFAKLRNDIKAGKRFIGFINPVRTVSFYVRQEDEGE